MSLSVELLKRLNTNEEPLSKRLKLAENAFCAIDIPIIHKNDHILRWLCNTHPMDQKIWNSLKNCLKTKYLNIKTNIIKMLIKTIIETFQKDIKYIYKDIFECCSLLISNNGIQQYFISKPEDLGLLIKSLLECVNNIFKNTFNIKKPSIDGIKISLINKSNELILTAYNTIINVIENLIQIYKSAFTKKDILKVIFINDILYPLCVIIDHTCTDNSNRLGAITHKCIQQLVFERKYIQNEKFLIDENIMKNISLLMQNAKIKDLQSNLMIFNFFFRVAISTFKSNTIILDIILRKLIECSGIYRKKILSTLLKCLNDITFNFNNKVNDVTLFSYCQNIIDDILESKNMNNTDYDLLMQFCYFNPLLIEKRIQNIFRKIFVEESRLKYKHLMISILDASIHLKQEEKLISAILIVLKDNSNHVSIMENDMFFPNEFKQNLIKAINNITNSQSINILKTLTYHLKIDFLQMLQSNNKNGENILLFRAIVELFITFLNGICIFEYNRTFTSYQKFLIAFNDLKNVLSLLMIEILRLNYDEKIIILLTAIYSWNETQRMLNYYIPNTSSENLVLSISEHQWQQLIKKVKEFGNEKCKNNMNMLILQHIKMSQNILNKSFVMLNDLIGGLEYCWHFILKFDTEIIPFLNNEELLKVVHLLLADMTSNVDNFNKWVKILHKNNLQENKRLIIFILTCVFTQIGYLITESTTKSISKCFNAGYLLEAEIIECEKINNILISIKKEFLINKWVQIENILLCKIQVYLEVLLHLPIMFLSTNLKLIIFMFLFSLRMECNENNEIILLCNTMFSDLLERSSIDIFQYIEPSLLLPFLSQNRIFKKPLELFLRNCSYKNVKKYIKFSINSNKNMFFLLESMESIKPKLNNNQKIIIKKAEQKLIKIIIETIYFETKNLDHIKTLCLILKINIKNDNIDEKLKNIAESMIHDIFVNDKNNKISNELLQNGLQLMIIILRNKKIFQITNQIIKIIWYTLFKYPFVDVLLPLLELSEPKEFSEFIEELHNQLVKTLLNTQEKNLENICIIWNTILKIDMSNDRNKLRLIAINNLFQTIQTTNIPEKFLSSLLKLIQNILVTKHLYLPGYVIDMSIIFSLKSLEENTILICNDILALCNVLLKVRINLIRDRIPLLLILYRQILNIFTYKSKDIINKSDEHIFKCLALDIEKFTNSLTKLKKDMIRISPYLVADLLKLFSENSIASFVKISLQNCIYQLISICDQHGIALLSRTLSISMQEIFKTQLDTYNKFYKFVGKI